MKIFEKPYVVPCFDTDSKKQVKPKSFMDWAQEAAQLHAEQLHFGYDDFIGKNLAWVVTRFYARFVDPPKWKDVVTIRTWHKGLHRVVSVRDFQVLDSCGNVRIAATSSWVILDLATRQFSKAHFGIDNSDSVCLDNAVEHTADKVSMPQKGFSEVEHVSDHIVSYSDTDMNGHTNNASYMGWAMDAVGASVSMTRELLDFTVNFNHESKIDECVSIYRCYKDNEYYIEGKIEDKSVFTALIRFK